jgi:hypothetical protein
MFRLPSRFKVSFFVLATLPIFAACIGTQGQAQDTRREGRDTNANRRARVAREIQETYTHRWEVGGGGGYLRFRSGEYTQKNSEITFWLSPTYYFNEKLGVTGEIRYPGRQPADLRIPVPRRAHLPRPAAPEVRGRSLRARRRSDRQVRRRFQTYLCHHARLLAVHQRSAGLLYRCKR